MSTACIPGTSRGQEWASGLLETESWMVVSHLVGAVKQTQVSKEQPVILTAEPPRQPATKYLTVSANPPLPSANFLALTKLSVSTTFLYPCPTSYFDTQDGNPVDVLWVLIFPEAVGEQPARSQDLCLLFWSLGKEATMPSFSLFLGECTQQPL